MTTIVMVQAVEAGHLSSVKATFQMNSRSL